MSKTYHISQVKQEYNRYTYTVMAENIEEALDNFLMGTSEVSESNLSNGVYELESLTVVEGSETI